MAQPPKSPPSHQHGGEESDRTRDGGHARGGGEQEERTREESKGRPPGAKR